MPEAYLILRRIQRDATINVVMSSRKVPSSLPGFERDLNFLDRFSKNNRKLNFMKIRPVGMALFSSGRQADRQIDRQTDRIDEASRRFSQVLKGT